MKKLPSILLLFITFNFCYSQSLVERWNQYNNRYEYFNSYGDMVAYKVYNQYKNQWETFNVNSQNDYPKVQSSVNLPLIQQALASKQARYDYNKKKVTNTLSYLLEKQLTLKTTDDKIRNIQYRFAIEVVNVYANTRYDLSSDEITDNIISWFYKKYNQIVSEEF